MKTCPCSVCGKTIAFGDSASVAGRYLCSECLVAALSQETPPKEEEILRNVDPTVCQRCGKDGGDAEFPRLAGLPFCESCADFFRHRPFPSWLKLGALALLGVVLFTLAWSRRFIAAHSDLKELDTAVAAADFARAAALADSAAGRVPESPVIRAMADLFRGHALLSAGNPAEALIRFESCRKDAPKEWGVDNLILSARFQKALFSGDIDQAAALADAAARQMPDAKDFRPLADYLHGLVLLREDKSAEALTRFESCRKVLSKEWGVEKCICRARLGVSFDKQDYDGFLDAARNLLAAFPGEALSLAFVASALACKYATTGEEDFKNESLRYLAQAQAAGDDPGFAEYEMRIKHRLETREIIPGQEFHKRYPNGWPEPGRAKP